MRNYYTRGSVVGVASIADEMRENRFRWLGHVLRREQTVTVRLVKEMYVEGKREKVMVRVQVGDRGVKWTLRTTSNS